MCAHDEDDWGGLAVARRKRRSALWGASSVGHTPRGQADRTASLRAVFKGTQQRADSKAVDFVLS